MNYEEIARGETVDLIHLIDETVYYIDIQHLERKAYVKQGKIKGIQIRRIKRIGIVIGVDIQEKNNIPIEYVSYSKEEIEQKVKEYNNKTFDELIIG